MNVERLFRLKQWLLAFLLNPRTILSESYSTTDAINFHECEFVKNLLGIGSESELFRPILHLAEDTNLLKIGHKMTPLLESVRPPTS